MFRLGGGGSGDLEAGRPGNQETWRPGNRGRRHVHLDFGRCLYEHHEALSLKRLMLPYSGGPTCNLPTFNFLINRPTFNMQPSNHSSLSIRPFALKNYADGAPQDLQVQQRRVMADVIEIIFGIQMHRLIATSTDLPPSCDTRRHGKTLVLPGFVTCHNKG